MIALSARAKERNSCSLRALSATITAGHKPVLRLSLRRRTKLLLARHDQRKAKLNVVQVLAGKPSVIATTTITVKPKAQTKHPR